MNNFKKNGFRRKPLRRIIPAGKEPIKAISHKQLKGFIIQYQSAKSELEANVKNCDENLQALFTEVERRAAHEPNDEFKNLFRDFLLNH